MKAHWKPQPFIGHRLLVKVGAGALTAHATKRGQWFWTCIATENDEHTPEADLKAAQKTCLTRMRVYLQRWAEALDGTVTWEGTDD